jgi:NAD(P)H-dependent flavin oxidoreductase YrpB (nitropropane dioxygenase family)
VRTALCDLLGIESPVVLAPMGGAATPALAGAVSNAGGLGLLPLTWTAPDEIGSVVAETRRRTDRPFGVNLGVAWDQHARLAAALAAGVRVVSFFWGDATSLIAEAHEAGALVFVTVGTAEEGRNAAAAGADVVVAQGWEAGGHVWGTVSTLALVPRVVDAVAPIPVVAAGGIADGRGLAAVLVLGAAGAWVGTRFLAASEADVHPDYRRRILAAGESDTFYGTLFDRGWPDAPHRTLRNSTVDAWERAGRPAPGSRPGENDEPASRSDGSPVNRYASATPTTTMRGDVEPLSQWAGQGVGLVTREESAAEIVESLVAEAESVIKSLGGRDV